MTKIPTCMTFSQMGEPVDLHATNKERRSTVKGRRRRKRSGDSSAGATATGVFHLISLWTVLWMNTHSQKVDCFTFCIPPPQRFGARQAAAQISSWERLSFDGSSRKSGCQQIMKMSQAIPQQHQPQGQTLMQRHRRQQQLQQQYYQQQYSHKNGVNNNNQATITAQVAGSKIKTPAKNPQSSPSSNIASTLYKSLANYYRRNKVDIVDKIDAKNISSTVEAIRSINVTLSKERIISLPSHQRYHYRVKQLLDYNETYGTMDVPYNYAPDVQFAKWVSSQRYEYRLLMRRGSEIKSYLTPERRKLLDAIGFPWNVQSTYYHDEMKKLGAAAANHTDSSGDAPQQYSGSLTTRWMAKWHCLSQYRKEHGHVRVPEWYEYSIEGRNGTSNGAKVKLGIWVKNQRKNYRNHSDDESHEHWDRIHKLNELGFIWDTRSSTVGVKSSQLSSLGGPIDINVSGEENQYGSIYNATWMKRYQQLKDFHKAHGHFQIPTQSQWKDLSIWVKTQRVFYRQYQESKSWSKSEKSQGNNGDKVEDNHSPCYSGGFCANKERIQLLEDIGFDWNGTKGLEARWNETWWTRFDELRAFKDHFGHLDVGVGVDTDERNIYDGDTSNIDGRLSTSNLTKLHHWVKLQRVEYRRHRDGEKSSLNSERIEALSQIGFVWNKHQEMWREKFEQLKNFHDEYGTFDVPTVIPSRKSKMAALFSHRSSENDWERTIELGRWVAKQKMFFRRYRKGEKLQTHICDRMEQLDAIGFLGDEQHIGHVTTHRCATQEQKEALWNQYFAELEEFKREHGHCMVPHDHSNYLDEWVSLQRRRFRIIQKKIDQSKNVSEVEIEQLHRLRSIGFVFNVHDYKFQKNLNRLKRIKGKSYRHDRHLYAFVRRQRELYAKNAISQERIDKLDRIGFIWHPRSARDP